jgi:hypothetical protein
MTITIKGELEIDSQRGVIYFHTDIGMTILRICRLPVPIPNPKEMSSGLDITHMYGQNWRGDDKLTKKPTINPAFEKILEIPVEDMDLIFEQESEKERSKRRDKHA